MGNHIGLLVTGAPLAARSVDVAVALIRAGWTVSISATEAALPWLDPETVGTVTGTPLRVGYRDPGRASSQDADAVVVCPATFNTVTKAALGIADTLVHSVLCEAIGAERPIVMVPMVKHDLWNHPSWMTHIDTLRMAGVTFVDPQTGDDKPAPVFSGTGSEIATSFDPQWIVTAMTRRRPV